MPDVASLQQQLALVEARLATSGKEAAQGFRQSHREWLKARDAGLRIYLAAFPAAEREQRRFQFLADVARTRVTPENGKAQR